MRKVEVTGYIKHGYDVQFCGCSVFYSVWAVFV